MIDIDLDWQEQQQMTLDLWINACINDKEVMTKLNQAHQKILSFQEYDSSDVRDKLQYVYESSLAHVKHCQLLDKVSDMIENLHCELIRHGGIRDDEQRWHIETLANQVIHLIQNPEEKEQDHE